MSNQKNQTFHVRINEGPELQISTRTTTYIHAAMVAYAELDVPGEQRDKTHIEIWVPSLLPDYWPQLAALDGY